MAAHEINVVVEDVSDGWLATVAVRDQDGESGHRVRISPDALGRLAPGATAEELARASFEYLLEREPKESILRSFDIDVIARYFPDYPREIRARLHR